MMPCDQDVSRKRFQRSPSLDNLDEFSSELQKQTLLDLSLDKLHQEQAQQIEPSLLKSVMISNAVKALHHQMVNASLSSSGDPVSIEKGEDIVFTNCTMNTSPSSANCQTSLSPVVPRKFPKLDTSFRCRPLALTQQATDENFMHPLLPIADQTHDDPHPFFSHNYTEVATSTSFSMDTVNAESQVTKSLPTKGNTMEGHCENPNSESDIKKCGYEHMDASLSPLDLKGIDPLLYDFDARNPPAMLPSPSETKVDHFSLHSPKTTNVNAAIDNKDMENDTSVRLDEIVNMLIDT